MLRLEPRTNAPWWLGIATPVIAVLATMIAGGLLFALMGFDPVAAIRTIFWDPLFGQAAAYSRPQLLVKAGPLILIACGLALGFRAGIWNIGAEGQLLIGALAGSALAVNIIDWDSRWALVLTLLLGTLGGAAWAGLCAWLKTAFNANEILTSIMLNYIALNLLLFAVHGPLKDPEGFNFPESAMFGDATRLPELIEGLRVHGGFYFALLALGDRSYQHYCAFGHRLDDWLRHPRARASAKSPLGEPLAYIVRYRDGLGCFLTDGRVEIDSNAVERTIRPIALNRKNALFAGHDAGAENWAVIASLIETCKMNGVDPQTWLANTLTAIVSGHKQSQINDLLPWNYAAKV